MQEYPHHYHVSSAAEISGDVIIQSGDLPDIATAPPTEYGGPGDRWSPESLLVASVADCFSLSFRAIAHASSFPWVSLVCEVEGVLDQVEGLTQFTDFFIKADLTLAADNNRATGLLEKAENICLITNSLKANTHLTCGVIVLP